MIEDVNYLPLKQAHLRALAARLWASNPSAAGVVVSDGENKNIFKECEELPVAGKDVGHE